MSVDPSPRTLALVADYFKVLSEVSRLHVLNCLRSGPRNVTEIVEATGLGQANVSKHLKVLTQAGIVNRNPMGVSVYYEIVDPVIFNLCEIVCDRIGDRLIKEAQHFESLQLSSIAR